MSSSSRVNGNDYQTKPRSENVFSTTREKMKSLQGIFTPTLQKPQGAFGTSDYSHTKQNLNQTIQVGKNPRNNSFTQIQVSSARQKLDSNLNVDYDMSRDQGDFRSQKRKQIITDIASKIHKKHMSFTNSTLDWYQGSENETSARSINKDRVMLEKVEKFANSQLSGK